MRKLVYIIIFCWLPIVLLSQLVETRSTNYCSESNKGTISVDIFQKNPPKYPPPFRVEYVNLDTDIYGELIVGNNFVLQDLDPGAYELTLHLDADVMNG